MQSRHRIQEPRRASTFEQETSRLLRQGFKLIGTSAFGSRYFFHDDGRRVRVADHPPNARTRNWMARNNVQSIRVNGPSRPPQGVAYESDLAPAASELLRLTHDAERYLCACAFADVHKLLPVADALGVETGTFDGSDTRAIWCAGLWGINSGRVRGEDRDADQAAVAVLVRRALNVVNCWRDQEQGATSSLWSPRKTVDLLFDGMFPSIALTEDAARQLLRLKRRMDRAHELYEQTRQTLESDDGRPEPIAVKVMPFRGSKGNA